MDDDAEIGTEDQRVAGRAELLPEEKEVGSEDAEAQAEAIIEDSDARTFDREAAPGPQVEHRRSADTARGAL